MINLCICQIIKDEHDYIEEWIEYHHNIGINAFYLIEDWNSKSHVDILKKYDYVYLYKIKDICNAKELDMLENGIFKQRIVYHIFDRLWKNKYDWMVFIDPDEYIDCSKDKLYEVLNNNLHKLAITMPWVWMKSNYLHHPNNHQKYNIFNTYIYPCKSFSYKHNVKCIINCKHIDSTLDNFKFIPHMFTIKGNNYINNCGISLKHFLFKSLEEYIKRLTQKGELKNATWNRKISDWFKCNEVECTDDIINEFDLNNIKVKCNDYNNITYK